MSYLFLLIAIVAEVVATSTLKATREFTQLGPSLVVGLGYATAFYFLALSLRTIPVGIAYAVWAGLGIVLITLAGTVVYRQVPDLPAVIGMALIITGVMVIHLFSRVVAH